MRNYVIENGNLIEYQGKAKHVVIPNGVTSIGCYAFYDCENVTSIKIPNNVAEIDSGAFFGVKDVKPQYNANGKLRAYKAFFKDWTCKNNFHYEIGKSYHKKGKILCCVKGFHACPNPLNVFNHYYGKLSNLHFAEVELSGEMDCELDKVAASDITIVRELTAIELVKIYNSMEKC